MRAVIRDIEKPPGGWRYTVPETNVLLTADFFEELWKKVIAHRRANSLGVPEGYREFLEDAACAETNPRGSHCGERKPKPRAKSAPNRLMMSHVERFLKTVWHAIVARKFVTRDEAVRRAAVCAGCPLKSEMPSGCTGCYTLLKKADKLLSKNGAIVVEPDGDGIVRDVCGACGCFIPLKVVLENSTLDDAEGEQRPAYWKNCWRNDK
jgi:hypothetical protein